MPGTFTVGALVVSTVSIFNSIGRLFWEGLAVKLGGYNTLVIVYLLPASVCCYCCSSTAILRYSSALTGVGFAFMPVPLVIFHGLTSQNFGMRNQGLNYGFMYFGFAVGALCSLRQIRYCKIYRKLQYGIYFDHGAIAR